MDLILIILLPSLLLIGTVLNYMAEKTRSNLLQMIGILGLILSMGVGLALVHTEYHVPESIVLISLRWLALISLVVFIISYLSTIHFKFTTL